MVPVNTVNGWRARPVRIGGGYGGSCDGSVPFETEDGGEIIDAIPIAAIECKWQAFEYAKNWNSNEFIIIRYVF